MKAERRDDEAGTARQSVIWGRPSQICQWAQLWAAQHWSATLRPSAMSISWCRRRLTSGRRQHGKERRASPRRGPLSVGRSRARQVTADTCATSTLAYALTAYRTPYRTPHRNVHGRTEQHVVAPDRIMCSVRRKQRERRRWRRRLRWRRQCGNLCKGSRAPHSDASTQRELVRPLHGMRPS